LFLGELSEVVTISTPADVQINEFKPWLEKETVDILRPLKEQGKKLVSKVKERLDDARDACGKLEEEGCKQLDKGKAVRKAKLTQKLTRYFLKQFDKIIVTDEPSFNELTKLHKDLEKVVSSIMRERSLWFPRISPLFIIARKRVDFAFARLAGSVSELGAFLSTDFSKAETVENLFSEIDETMRLLEGLDTYEERKKMIETKVESIRRQIEEGEERVESMRKSTELGDLARTRSRTEELRKQVKYELRHLQKPLAKFANLTRGPGYALSSEEVDKLGKYLENPFAALATETPGCPILKSILRKVGRAMDEGKLKLKTSRLRKGREKIDEILGKEVLNELHQSCVQVYSTRQQLVSSEKTKAAQQESMQMQRKLKEMRKRKEAGEARLRALEKQHSGLQEKVHGQKKSIEKLVYDVLQRNVNVKLG